MDKFLGETYMEKKRRLSEFSFSRVIPSTITLSALCIGLTSIKYGLAGRLDIAVICILFSAIFDALDGRVARFLGCPSQFGAELDSLSDLVCFGVSPAVLMYIVSLKSGGTLGWAVCLYFAVCCGLRLARFNVMQINDSHAKSEDKTPAELKVFFTGIPAPAGAILGILPIIMFLQIGFYSAISPFVCGLFLVTSGTLMVSKIHTLSSKMIKFAPKYMPFALLITSTVVIFLIVEPWLTLLILAVGYIFSIPYGEVAYKKAESLVKSKKDTDK